MFPHPAEKGVPLVNLFCTTVRRSRRKRNWHFQIIICLLVFLMNAYGQTPQDQDLSIKVGVEEVRIDATVLDNNGRQIDDSTVDDFEVYQDGKLQQITSCIYVANSQKPEAVVSLPGNFQSGVAGTSANAGKEEGPADDCFSI
jgi:hypothetical protein